MTTILEWQFGGWLRDWPPVAAWSALGFIALAGLALIILSYRRTAGELTPGMRLLLVQLRAGVLVLLLFCLANPTRVNRSRPETAARELAVLVDRSASMSQPDYRGETRLADAIRTWKQHEAETSATFSKVNYRRFAIGTESTADLNDAAKISGKDGETHLYAALGETLKEHPAAIVCLTDGLDTTTDKISTVMDAATDQGVPLYFVAGNNRLRAAGETMKIREVKIPGRVLRQSRFTASAIVEMFSPAATELPLELWRGETRLARTNQPVREGMNLIVWPVEVSAGEIGALPLEFRVGTGSRQQIAGRMTRVVENTSVNLLYYQGALQWGYRFLRGALEGDPSFHVTAILNPALGVQMTAGAEDQLGLADLPEDARELKRFQIVVLANAFADLMTPRQQQALMDYARGGGGVLFISPDNDATRRFSGTILEQMLPVVFENGRDTGSSDSERRFQEQMRAANGADPARGIQFASQTLARQVLPRLVPFQPLPGAGERLFRSPGEVPRFNTYARVKAVKPGAEILAVHPTDRSPDNSPRVLVARQQFGDGFTAAMNTDLLWRWKLSLASTNRAPEIFWQQFFLALAPPMTAESLDLTCGTEAPQLHRTVRLQVTGASDAAPTLTVQSPQGETERLKLTPVAAENPGTWQATFVPETAGNWIAKAGIPQGDEAKISIAVLAQTRSAELMNLPPDVDGLRQLAEATGGALIEPGRPVFNQHAVERPGEILKARPLWNRGWLVALLLAIYAAELVVRRFYKLL